MCFFRPQLQFVLPKVPFDTAPVYRMLCLAQVPSEVLPKTRIQPEALAGPGGHGPLTERWVGLTTRWRY